ncbi:xanthine dehydrogenase accessory protein XdhC [Halomonas salipaludis]|uniref:Xanthine dehydrogenase accessory protein XdhC n=1 Tax=Halomonas salipaludis TaxID=2032625 RepID=A0A2A2F325_9GAMM|nr:xanthine dehydrogenase accessory protein XdhC [Halomonas salipaludis]PAU79348.1 xanthine dehydrogenase accessory protein XdhC [Halomonas salipaludis]
MHRPEASLQQQGTALPWHAALHSLQREAQPHALASVVGAAGSTPREPGAKMVITEDAVHDTLGGGSFEFQVIACAREALAQGESGTRLEAFPLGGRSGQCCGGYVHVLIELFAGAEMQVAVFGAGHVGQALVGLIAPLAWRVHWFDSRDDVFPATQQPRLVKHHAPDPAVAVAKLPRGCHALVMTHDHGEDCALVDALLARGDCASIGLIGSHSKWASFQRRLRDAGHPQARLEREVRCPIGVAGAKGKLPYEIALSVVTELLTLKPAVAHDDRRGVAPDTLREAFAPPTNE